MAQTQSSPPPVSVTHDDFDIQPDGTLTIKPDAAARLKQLAQQAQAQNPNLASTTAGAMRVDI